jgi:hypothetical protein
VIASAIGFILLPLSAEDQESIGVGAGINGSDDTKNAWHPFIDLSTR